VLVNHFKPVLLKRKGVALGVWGEAGIGKSHTVQQLLKELPCRTASLHATAALTAFVQPLPKTKKLASWAERTLARLVNNEATETSAFSTQWVLPLPP
jgi:ABC-type microcin C transport system duplicated ATPase subunit YejF